MSGVFFNWAAQNSSGFQSFSSADETGVSRTRTQTASVPDAPKARVTMRLEPSKTVQTCPMLISAIKVHFPCKRTILYVFFLSNAWTIPTITQITYLNRYTMFTGMKKFGVSRVIAGVYITRSSSENVSFSCVVFINHLNTPKVTSVHKMSNGNVQMNLSKTVGTLYIVNPHKNRCRQTTRSSFWYDFYVFRMTKTTAILKRKLVIGSVFIDFQIELMYI